MQIRSPKYLYWILQVSGWGMGGVIMWFFAHTYQVDISGSKFFGRIAVVFTLGILVTHLLRMITKWGGWMLQPVEKVIPKLGLGVVVASLLFSFIVLKAIEYLNVTFWGKIPRLQAKTLV